MSIPVQVRRFVYAVAITVVGDLVANWVEHSWSTLGINTHTVVQFVLLLIFAAVCVFSGGFISDREKDRQLRELKAAHLRRLLNEGTFWLQKSGNQSDLWQQGCSSWIQYTHDRLHAYLGKWAADRFYALDGLDPIPQNTPANEVAIIHLRREVDNLRRLLEPTA